MTIITLYHLNSRWIGAKQGKKHVQCFGTEAE